MPLCYEILTIGTWDSFFPSSCFSGQNEMFSTTKQNQTSYSFFFLIFPGSGILPLPCFLLLQFRNSACKRQFFLQIRAAADKCRLRQPPLNTLSLYSLLFTHTCPVTFILPIPNCCVLCTPQFSKVTIPPASNLASDFRPLNLGITNFSQTL